MADDPAEALARCAESADRGIAVVQDADVAQGDVQTLDVSAQAFVEPDEAAVRAAVVVTYALPASERRTADQGG